MSTCEDLLILTKTYPLPSANYREHTCVVAINAQSQLRRLYPIPFRLLAEDHQFRRWEWINASISKSSDRRPESHNIDIDSIVRKKRIETSRGWADRLQWLEPHLMDSMNAIEERRLSTNLSLAVIKATDIILELEEVENLEWTSRELTYLTKTGLFDSHDVKQRTLLRKLPYQFYYRYNCILPDGTKESNRHRVTDWEFGTLYWNCVKRYQSDWEEFFRKKVEIEFGNKNLHFLMGNMHRFQDQWLIVGVIYPPAISAIQNQLWPEGPNV